MTDPQPLGPIVDNWTPPPVPDRAVIAGQYAQLEPLSTDHAGDLHACNSEDQDGAIWTYLYEDPPASLAAYSRWVRQAAAREDMLFFAIRDRTTGRVPGLLAFLRIAPEAGSIEVGNITFSPLLQRSRVGSEAIILTARTAFQLGYRRFEWKCNALNLPSRRAAQRFGFSYEGVFRQAAVVKGRNRDTAWFAMIDAEFEALDAAWSTWLAPDNFLNSGKQIRALSDLTRPLLVAIDPALTS